jgi:hypothetical protein
MAEAATLIRRHRPDALHSLRHRLADTELAAVNAPSRQVWKTLGVPKSRLLEDNGLLLLWATLSPHTKAGRATIDMVPRPSPHAVLEELPAAAKGTVPTQGVALAFAAHRRHHASVASRHLWDNQCLQGALSVQRLRFLLEDICHLVQAVAD